MTDKKIEPAHPEAPLTDDRGDFIFRFALPDDSQKPLHDDPLVEMVRKQVVNLLKVLTLTSDNKDVSVDGFKMMNDPDTVYRLFPEDEEKG